MASPGPYTPTMGMFSGVVNRMWRVIGFQQQLKGGGSDEEVFFVTVEDASQMDENMPRDTRVFPVEQGEYDELGLGDVIHVSLNVEPRIGR